GLRRAGHDLPGVSASAGSRPGSYLGEPGQDPDCRAGRSVHAPGVRTTHRL
ncbi:uncharacterized protein METZ01_LOCUS148505, partial [marine metagenome]